MLPYPSKRSIFTLLFVFLAFLTIFYFPQPFPPNAYALDSNNCENGWTFNGGDAGDDNNWEYTGCEEGGGNGGNDDNDGDDDSDNNNNDDNNDDDNNDNGGGVEAGYCENGWTFRGGDAGDDDNWRYTGCGQNNDDDDNSDNSEEDCNRAGGTWRDDRCFTSASSNDNNSNQIEAGYCENGWTFKGGDAGDNNSWEYTRCGMGEVDSDSNEEECNRAGGTWTDNRCYTPASSNEVKAGYCENGWTFKGGDAGDNNSWEYTGCGLGQVDSDTNEQECNKAGGSWRDNRCYTAASSSNVTAGYCENGWLFKGGDAGDNNSWEYNGCGIDGGSTGENDGACPSNQYWDINVGSCVNSNTEQAAINDEIYCREECGGSCGGSVGAKYCTNTDGSRKFNCNNPEDQWKAECQNQLLNEFRGAGLEQVDTSGYQACGFADLADSGCVGLQYCRLHILYCDGEPKGQAKPGGNCELVAGKCGVEQDANGNKYVAETGAPAIAQPISESGQIIDASLPNPEELQRTKDASCKETNAVNHYCDGNICIEQSSGWDGAACVNVYSTVNASQCPNSCAGNNATSGQEIKLLNCLDEVDAAKRAECQKENTRIAQTGQKLDQASLIKASLTVDDCTSLEGEAKEACENKNTETRFLGRVLDNVRLESCSSGSEQEKKDCTERNQQAIKLEQNRQNLGIKDCSSLTGEAKINCEFGNYEKDKIAQAAASFKPENCAAQVGEAAINECNERNQKAYQTAVSSVSAFVGLAELGAQCVYTEACADGGKKACAGKVASDNGAPVCKYDPSQASCSACTTESLNLTSKENKCSEDGQTCLNAPGYICVNDAQCQTKTAALQQAAADAPIDPARLFSQKFEEGKSCLQPEICDLGDGSQGEHVCYGKGDVEGKCDLSQGGGVCSACQAKGTIKINKEATCNAENKCVGAPALSGCMNDEQCKPVVVTPARTIRQGGAVGPGQIQGQDGCAYNAVTSCKTIETRAADYYTTSFSNSPDARDLNRDKAVEQHQECVTDYIKASCPTYITTAPVIASQAVTNHVQYNYAVTEASVATNQLDQYGAAVVRDLGYIPVETAAKLEKLQADQEAALEKLRQAEKAINILPQASLSLDRSTVDSQVAGLEKVNQILDTNQQVSRDLAAAQQLRLQYDRSNDYNPDSNISIARPEDDPLYRQKLAEAEQGINRLKELGSKGSAATFEDQLNTIPSRTNAIRSTERLVESGTQMANLLEAHAKLNGQTNVGREEVEFLQDAGLSYVDKLRTQGGTVATAQANQLEARVGNAAYNAWKAEYEQEFAAGKSLDPDTNNAIGGIINGLNTSVEHIAVVDPAKAKQLRVEARVIPEIVAAQAYSNHVKSQVANGHLTADEKAALDEGFNTIIRAATSKAGDGVIVGDLQDKYANAVVEGTAQRLVNERLAIARAGNIETDEQSAELSRQFREQVINPLTLANQADTARQLQNSFNTAPSVGSAQGNISLATRLAVNDVGNPDKDLTPQTTALENARLSLSVLPETPEKAKLQTDLANFNQNVSTILDRKRAVDSFREDVTWAAYNAANQNNSAVTAERVETARARFGALPDDLKADPVLAAQANSLDTIAKIGDQRKVMNDWYQTAAQAKAAGDEAGYQDALEKARNIYGATVAETITLPQNLRTGALTSLTGESNKNELEVGTRVAERAAELSEGRVEQSAARIILPAKGIAGLVVQADTAVKCFTVYSLTEGCQAVRSSTVSTGSQLVASAQNWLGEHPTVRDPLSFIGAIGYDAGQSFVNDGITATDSTRSSSEKMQAGLATLNATGDLSAAMRAAGLSTQYGIWNTNYYDTPQVKQRAEETAAQVGILPKNYEQMLKAGKMTQEQVDAAMKPENWSPTQNQAFFAFLPHEDPNPLKWLSNNLLNAAIDVNPFIHQGSAQLICADTYGSLCYTGFGESISMNPEDYTKANRVLSEVFPGYTPSDYQSFSIYANAKASCMATGSGAANNEFCTSYTVKQLGLTPDEAAKLEKDFNAYGYAAEYVKSNTEPGKFAWEMQLNVSESVGNTAVTAAIALPIAAATGGTGFASLTGLDALQIVPALARGGVKLASVGVREMLPEAAGLLRESVGAAVDAPWSQKVPAFFGPEIWDAPKYARNADDAVVAARQSVLAAQDNLLRVQQARSDFEAKIRSDPAFAADPQLPAYLNLADARVKEAESTLVAAYSASGKQVNDLVRYDQEVFEAQISLNRIQADIENVPVNQIDALSIQADAASAALQQARINAVVRELGETVSEVDAVRLAQEKVDNLRLFELNGATVDPVRVQIANDELAEAYAQAIQDQYGIPLDQTPQVASIPPPSPNIFERIADGLGAITSRFTGNTSVTTPPAAAAPQASVDPTLLNNLRNHPDVRGYGVSSDATGQKITVNFRDGRPAEEFTPDQLRADSRFNPNASNTQNTAQAAPNTGTTANNSQPNVAQPRPATPGTNTTSVPDPAVASNVTTPPLTPANPTIPNAPGWVNRVTNRVANWLQAVDRPLNWLTSAPPANTSLLNGSALDRASAASLASRLSNDIPPLEAQVAQATQERSDLLINRLILLKDIEGLEARRSNILWRWGKRKLNIGDDLEIQLGLKKDQLDKINLAIKTNSDDLQTKNRILTTARTELKQAEDVLNPTSISSQVNVRSTKERELAKRADDLAKANNELTYSPIEIWQERPAGEVKPTLVEKLTASQQKLAALQAQMARDSENISVLKPEMQQRWLAAYNKVIELEGDTTTSKAVLDQAREELRVAREGLAFRKVSEKTYAEALTARNNLKSEYEKLYFDANAAALDVNKLATEVDYYRAKVFTSAASGNEINDANRRLLNTLSPTAGFSEASGFGLWKQPAKTDVAFFMDTTGRLGISDTGKQGLWIIARYQKSGDGTVILDQIILPHTAPQNLREFAKAATPGKWLPGKLSGDIKIIAESEFNTTFAAAQKVNTQQVPIVINPATSATRLVTDIEREVVMDFTGFQRVNFDISTGKATLVNPVSDDQIRAALIRQGMRDTDPDLNAAIRRISDEINPKTPTPPAPATAPNIPANPTTQAPASINSVSAISPFAQAAREIPVNPRTNTAISAVVDNLGDQLDAFYISLENSLRHASARTNLNQLPEIRALLIQAENRLDQIKPEYTNAVQQQKLIMQRVEEARASGTLNQAAIDQFNRELAPLNDSISRLKPVYLELEIEIIPEIRTEYRIPSATVGNRVGEELTRRGINPSLLSADEKIDLYLQLKQANSVAPANPASVPPVTQAVQNVTGAVQVVVTTADDAAGSIASAVRNAVSTAPAPVQTAGNAAADVVDGVLQTPLAGMPVIGPTAILAAEGLEEAARVARILGNDTLAESLEAQARILKAGQNTSQIPPLTDDSVLIDDSADLLTDGAVITSPTGIPIATRVDDAVSQAFYPLGSLVDDLERINTSGNPPPVPLTPSQLRDLNSAIKIAVRDGKVTPELADFWKGLVRDAGEIGPDGNMRQVHPYIYPDGHYFYGYQPTVDLSKGNFINANLALRAYVTDSLSDPRNFSSSNVFLNWLRAAHQEIAYKPDMQGGALVPGRMVSEGHFEIVNTYVARVARDLNDPYFDNLMAVRNKNIDVEQYLQLPGISKGGASKDWNYPYGLTHNYPDPRFTNEYFEQMRLRMQQLTTDRTLSLEDQLRLIAESYQYGVVARSFREVNNSLYLGIANTMLAERGLKPVSAGFLDFAAMRLQQENFVELFIREVEKTNPDVNVRSGFLGSANCNLASIPQASNLAQANQTSNVLGASTGEVLAASTGPCGPLSSLVQSVPGLDDIPGVAAAADGVDDVVLDFQKSAGELLDEILPQPASQFDDIVPVARQALPEPNWVEARTEIDTLTASLKKNEIDLPTYTQKIEEITQTNTPLAKTAEAALLVDDKFIKTGIITGQTGLEKTFGEEAWVDWLNARTAARAYGKQPLTVDFIRDLHIRLTGTTDPSIGGSPRIGAARGGDYSQPGPATYTKEQADEIRNNPLLEFLQRGEDPNAGIIEYPSLNSEKGRKIYESLPQDAKDRIGPVGKTASIPANQAFVEELLNDLAKWYNQQASNPSHNPFQLAAELQRRLITIHPYGDVNGRLSRNLMNWSLENAGKTPPILSEFNDDIILPLESWTEQIKNGSQKAEEMAKWRQTLERIGITDEAEMLGLSEDKTFYDFFFNEFGLAPSPVAPGGKLIHRDYDNFLTELRAARAEFETKFKGQVSANVFGTSLPAAIPVGGLVPESYMNALQIKPQDFEAYERYIRGRFYTDAKLYRGGKTTDAITTHEDILRLFEEPVAIGTSNYAVGLQEVSLRWTRKMKEENILAALQKHNDLLATDFRYDADESVRIIKTHTSTDYNKISPYASTGIEKHNGAGWAMGLTEEPNGVLFTMKAPISGAIDTYTSSQTAGISAYQGKILSSLENEQEVIIPGGINPHTIEQIEIYTNGDPYGQASHTAKKVITDDGIFVVITDKQGRSTFQLNPHTGKYQPTNYKVADELLTDPVIPESFPSQIVETFEQAAANALSDISDINLPSFLKPVENLDTIPVGQAGNVTELISDATPFTPHLPQTDFATAPLETVIDSSDSIYNIQTNLYAKAVASSDPPGLIFNNIFYPYEDIASRITAYYYNDAPLYTIPTEFGLREKVQKIKFDQVSAFLTNNYIQTAANNLNFKWKSGDIKNTNISFYLAPDTSIYTNKYAAPPGSSKIEAFITTLPDLQQSKVEEIIFSDGTPEKLIASVKQNFTDNVSNTPPIVYTIPKSNTWIDKTINATHSLFQNIAEVKYNVGQNFKLNMAALKAELNQISVSEMISNLLNKKTP